MDIDMAVLRSLEREKEISFDVLVDAIEQALLVAYHRTPGAQEDARVEPRPQVRPRHRVLVAGARRGGRGASASGTTRRRASAGSPRPPPSR